jgi:hypothetical protein
MADKLFNPKKDKHVDRLDEKNMNQILHVLAPSAKLGSPTMYETTAWHMGLRGDRKEKI